MLPTCYRRVTDVLPTCYRRVTICCWSHEFKEFNWHVIRISCYPPLTRVTFTHRNTSMSRLDHDLACLVYLMPQPPHTPTHTHTPPHTSTHPHKPQDTSIHLYTIPYTSKHVHTHLILPHPSTHYHTPPHTPHPSTHYHTPPHTPPHTTTPLHTPQQCYVFFFRNVSELLRCEALTRNNLI